MNFLRWLFGRPIKKKQNLNSLGRPLSPNVMRTIPRGATRRNDARPVSEPSMVNPVPQDNLASPLNPFNISLMALASEMPSAYPPADPSLAPSSDYSPPDTSYSAPDSSSSSFDSGSMGSDSSFSSSPDSSSF